MMIDDDDKDGYDESVACGDDGMYDTRIVAHPCEKFAGLRDFHGSCVRRYTTLEMTLKGHFKIFMIITPPKIDNIPLKDNNLDNFWTSMDRVCGVTQPWR